MIVHALYKNTHISSGIHTTFHRGCYILRFIYCFVEKAQINYTTFFPIQYIWSPVLSTVEVDSRMQVGISPDHSPFTWQVLKALPLSMNPLLQTYIALDPRVVPPSRMRPFSGEFSLPQSTTNGRSLRFHSKIYHLSVFGLIAFSLRLQIGASPIHWPLARHFLMFLPTNENPLLQV